MNVDLGGRVRLGHNHDVRRAQDGLSRVVRCLVTGPQRVDEYDLQAWSNKRKIIVAPVPDDDVCLTLGKSEDAGVVHAGEHNIAGTDMWFVFLTLFDRARSRIQICKTCETLDRLALEVAVGHGMTEDCDLKPA
jgi:hypothetical protein